MALVYVLLISGTLCGAGFAADLIRSLFRRSTRVVWLLILIVSSAGPIAVMLWAQHEPAALEYQTLSLPLQLVAQNIDANGTEVDRRQGVAPPTNPAATTSTTASETAHWSLAELVVRIWTALSTGAMIVIAAASLIVTRRARRWTAGQLHGVPVRISDDVGPAVIGILRPYIVVPRWLLAKSVVVRRVTVTHELEHIRARDPALWRLGLVLVALTPWNPIVWWQLRRLQLAIEKDCDQRVLTRGIDASEYGRALLDIAQSQAALPFGAVALAERVSQLERRIRSILGRPRGYGYRFAWAALAGVAMLGCITLAAEVRPPGAEGVAAPRWPAAEDGSPFWPEAEKAARDRYPALFAGRLTGTVLITVDLLYDGTVLTSSTEEFPPGPLPGVRDRKGGSDPQSLDRMIAWRNEGVWGSKYHFLGWFGPKRSNGLYASYHILKWPPDPERNTERAELAVSAKYPGYFKSHSSGNDEGQTVKTLTVLLNDSDTIAREKWGTDDERDAGETAASSHFRAMNLEPSNLAHWGEFANFHWNGRAYTHLPPLRVFYAWPRRRRDPVLSGALIRKAEISAQRGTPSWESANDNATRLLKFYFRDVWEHGTASPDQMVWFLLDRSGAVIDHGYGKSAHDTTALRSPEHHPGIRIGNFVSVGVETMNGQTVPATFEWLRADSPPP
jgi:beta-lactamase regulating signal transducer with metallopeptidase domain